MAVSRVSPTESERRIWILRPDVPKDLAEAAGSFLPGAEICWSLKRREVRTKSGGRTYVGWRSLCRCTALHLRH